MTFPSFPALEPTDALTKALDLTLELAWEIVVNKS